MEPEEGNVLREWRRWVFQIHFSVCEFFRSCFNLLRSMLNSFSLLIAWSQSFLFYLMLFLGCLWMLRIVWIRN
jgi:hypothetical protein